ncbi:MAG: hypothetical protein WCL50_05790 [Spirochaetota bacterium]
MTFPRAALAPSKKAEARDDIGIEARSPIDIAIEQCLDAGTVGDQGFRGIVPILEAAKARICVELSGKGHEEVILPPRRTLPALPEWIEP